MHIWYKTWFDFLTNKNKKGSFSPICCSQTYIKAPNYTKLLQFSKSNLSNAQFWWFCVAIVRKSKFSSVELFQFIEFHAMEEETIFVRITPFVYYINRWGAWVIFHRAHTATFTTSGAQQHADATSLEVQKSANRACTNMACSEFVICTEAAAAAKGKKQKSPFPEASCLNSGVRLLERGEKGRAAGECAEKESQISKGVPLCNVNLSAWFTRRATASFLLHSARPINERTRHKRQLLAVLWMRQQKPTKTVKADFSVLSALWPSVFLLLYGCNSAKKS